MLVLGKALADDLDALAQARRLLERLHHVVVQFLLEVGEILATAAVALQFLDLSFEFVHPRRDLLQLLHERLDLLRADRQFLDERDRLAAPEAKTAAELPLVVLGDAGVEDLLEVPLVLLHQMFERPQVVRHPLEDLVFLEVLGEGNLDGAIEGKLAGVDALEGLDHLAKYPVAFENLASETLAGDLDLLGQRDFLVAAQERDLAHLREVHPHRVIDAAAVLLFEKAEIDLGTQLVVNFGGLGGATLALLGLRLVDQLDALVLEQDQELIQFLGVDGVIRQIVVDLAVCQVAFLLALVEQSFQALVDLLHQTLPSAIFDLRFQICDWMAGSRKGASRARCLIPAGPPAESSDPSEPPIENRKSKIETYRPSWFCSCRSSSSAAVWSLAAWSWLLISCLSRSARRSRKNFRSLSR